MQQDRDDHRVGSIAMQAAHNAGCIPLFMSHIFYRGMRPVEAAVKRDEKVYSANQDYPEQEERQGAEVIQRIPLGTEGNVEPRLEREIDSL